MIQIEEKYKGENNSRVCIVTINSKKMLTPFYFPSITSAETRSNISNTISFITHGNYPAILVSCYDLYKSIRLKKEEVKQLIDFNNKGENYVHLFIG